MIPICLSLILPTGLLNFCYSVLSDYRFIAALLYLKVNQIMLGVLVDELALGVYAAVARF